MNSTIQRTIKCLRGENVYFYSHAIKDRFWADFLSLASLLQLQKAFFISQLNWPSDSCGALNRAVSIVIYLLCSVGSTGLKELVRAAGYSSFPPGETPSLPAFPHLPLPKPLPSAVPRLSLPRSWKIPLCLSLASKSCWRWERLSIELGGSARAAQCYWWCILMRCESHTKK